MMTTLPSASAVARNGGQQMLAETIAAAHTWRLLWSHSAYRIISNLAATSTCQLVSAGYGWGLRDPADDRHALLLHPSGNGREVGDLALLVLGQGSEIIPRSNWSYPEYLDNVAAVVEKVARAYLPE